MNKQKKFLLFVQIILAARKIEEKLALTIIDDATKVTEKELISCQSLKMDALDFVNWRGGYTKNANSFDYAPGWLNQKTIGKILFG